MVGKLGCKSISDSITSRFDNFRTGPKYVAEGCWRKGALCFFRSTAGSLLRFGPQKIDGQGLSWFITTPRSVIAGTSTIRESCSTFLLRAVTSPHGANEVVE